MTVSVRFLTALIAKYLKDEFEVNVPPERVFQFKDSRLSCNNIHKEMVAFLEHGGQPTRLAETGYVAIRAPHEEHHFWARKSTTVDIQKLELHGPEYLALRTPDYHIPKWLVKRFTGRVQRVLRGNGVYPGIQVFTTNDDDNRSDFHAPHIGVWAHYSKFLLGPRGLRLTKDTYAQEDSGAADALLLFLYDVQDHLAPILNQLLKEIDPLIWQCQMM